MKNVKHLFLLFMLLLIVTGCNNTTTKCQHYETEWIIDYNATCEDDGYKHQECVKCKQLLATDKIKSLGHDLIHHEKKDATCVAEGYYAYDTCTRCTYTTYVEIPALQHNFVDGICTKCGESIEVCGHAKTEWVIDRNPTCEE